MAKVTAPLLSLAASGSISKSIVFSRWKGIAYARVHVIPENPNTADQQEVRGVFATLNEMWKRMPGIAREPWIASVRGQPLTSRNRHIQHNVADLQDEADLDNLVMSVAGGQALPPENVTPADGGTQNITITADEPTAPTGYTLTGFQGAAIEDGDPSPVYTATTFVDENEVDPYSLDIDVLAAGTFQYAIWAKWTRDSDSRIFYSTAVRGQQVVA